jgi:hypothetical protein
LTVYKILNTIFYIQDRKEITRMKTKLAIEGRRFKINGKLTYSEIPGNNPKVHGLLMNARFIQAVFDDKADPGRFARFGRNRWDSERNTDDLIKALPDWHTWGLRAFTAGFQGGGPCFTINNASIDNNPFSEDGNAIDPAYLGRMERLIRAAGDLGMVVIVSYFYQGQSKRMKNGKTVRNAVRTASRWLRDKDFTNVIIEVANEYDVGTFKDRPLISNPECITGLMELAREESGGIPVGSSGGGGVISQEVAEESDVVLIHGNHLHAQEYYRFIKQVRSWVPDKPIVCNEDSPMFSQLDVAFDTGTSWGYYNNMTKQEPPVLWGIANAEDKFFARRMARGLGIPVTPLSEEEQYALEGVKGPWDYQGERWIRLVAEYPEKVSSVEFFLNGVPVEKVYSEPFFINYISTWLQKGYKTQKGDKWRAVIYLADGRVLERDTEAE